MRKKIRDTEALIESLKEENIIKIDEINNAFVKGKYTNHFIGILSTLRKGIMVAGKKLVRKNY